MLRAFLAAIVCAAACVAAGAQTPSYDLLRQPALSKTEIAFSYAGDLWIVDRSGGRADPVIPRAHSPDARRSSEAHARAMRVLGYPCRQSWVRYSI